MAGIISFFPILVAAFEGFRSIEPEALELMTMLSASPIQVFTKLRYPSALGNIFAGMKMEGENYSQLFGLLNQPRHQFTPISQYH
jgi:ABC-type nitrate/sulfonate/bicarbonate transport system permease component